MKRIQLVAIFAFTLVGCKEKPLDPILDPVVKKITVLAEAKSGVSIEPNGTSYFEVGTTVLYKLTIKDGYTLKSVKVNNSESTVVDGLISFTASANTKIVAEGVSNDLLILKKGIWNLTALEQYLEDSLEQYAILNEVQTSDYFIFTDSTLIGYHKNGDEFMNNLGVVYTYNESGKIIRMGKTLEVYQLSEDVVIFRRLIYTYPSGKKRYASQTYSRPKKIP